jgi:hypothetical protein
LVIFDLKIPAVAATPVAALLFVVLFATGTVELPHLLSLFPSENDRTSHHIASPSCFHLQ